MESETDALRYEVKNLCSALLLIPVKILSQLRNTNRTIDEPFVLNASVHQMSPSVLVLKTFAGGLCLSE